MFANINEAQFSNYEKGVNAESRAINMLKKMGYDLLKQRLRTPYGEIDAILRKGKTLIAVEIKQRKKMSNSLQSISMKQQHRISRAFLFFISQMKEVFENYRIDVVCFDSVWHAEYIENAFYIDDAA